MPQPEENQSKNGEISVDFKNQHYVFSSLNDTAQEKESVSKKNFSNGDRAFGEKNFKDYFQKHRHESGIAKQYLRNEFGWRPALYWLFCIKHSGQCNTRGQ